MSSVAFINSLIAAIPLLEVLVRMTSSQIDDWLLSLAKRLEGNDDLINELATWLAFVPGFESDPPPEQLKDLEISLLMLRDALWRTRGKSAQ
jgi:hypothetical protein